MYRFTVSLCLIYWFMHNYMYLRSTADDYLFSMELRYSNPFDIDDVIKWDSFYLL